MSCGLSLWAVPRNYKEIISKYNMKHIPHITIETNLKNPSYSTDIGNIVNVEYNKGLIKMKNVYNVPDILEISGYTCRLYGLNNTPKHHLHMSIFYDWDGDNYGIWPDPPDSSICDIVRADTTSMNPEDWCIWSYNNSKI